MYRPSRIVDSHIHLITEETHRARIARLAALGDELVRAYHQRWEESLTSRNEERPEDNPLQVEAVAARWEGELDRAGISRAVFFTSSEHHDEIFRFISCRPQIFIGYLTFDPRDERNAGLLETKVREGVIREQPEASTRKIMLKLAGYGKPLIEMPFHFTISVKPMKQHM